MDTLATGHLALISRFFLIAMMVLTGFAAAADMPDSAVCGAAGQAAELSGALPANLLLSIGIVESGRAVFREQGGRHRLRPARAILRRRRHRYRLFPDQPGIPSRCFRQPG
jgi:hypothetical protein